VTLIAPLWPETASLLTTTYPPHASPWRSYHTRSCATPFQQAKTGGKPQLFWQCIFLVVYEDEPNCSAEAARDKQKCHDQEREVGLHHSNHQMDWLGHGIQTLSELLRC